MSILLPGIFSQRTMVPNLAHPLNRGLVGWWLAAPGYNGFGGSKWFDISGRHNHGTLTNMDPPTDWKGDAPAGGFASLAWDNTARYVLRDNAPDILDGHDTCIAWVKPTSFENFQQIFATNNSGGTASNNELNFFLDANGDVERYDGAFTSGNGVGRLTLNEWACVATTFDGSNMRVFTNGRLNATAVGRSKPSVTTARWVIGSQIGGQHFDGLIGMIALYTRAFSVAEINAFYHESLAGYPNLLQRRTIFPLNNLASGTFPVVASTTETQISVASTTHNVSMPATVNSGDLLLMLFSLGGNNTTSPSPTLTTPTGWTQLYNEDERGFVRGAAYAKVADGTEGGTTVNVASSASRTGAAQVYRITDWFGSLAGVEAATPTETTSGTAPDPPSVSASWGSEDNLFIPVAHLGDDDEPIVTYPSGYTDGIDTITGGGNNNGATVASAVREVHATTEDPGAFSISGTESQVMSTIVVRPAGEGGGGGGNEGAAMYHHLQSMGAY